MKTWSPVLGRVSGIPIRLHPTFLLLLLLVLWSADPVRFAVTLVLVFASVTIHELAHSLAAQHRGVAVKDILLLPIGGVSELERLPDRPHDQLVVAGLGPVASAVIGTGLLALAGALGGAVWPANLAGGSLLHRIGWLNILLAGFNLLPALPLDGGRVLRAVLVGRMGPARATIVAARCGRLLGVVMIAFGLLYDAWLVLIGLFVLTGAAAEENAASVQVRLEGLRAGDVMGPVEEVGLGEFREMVAPDAVQVDEDTSLADAAGELARSEHSLAVVLRHGTPVGVVRFRDVARLLRR